jgi:hypothetical protein
MKRVCIAQIVGLVLASATAVQPADNTPQRGPLDPRGRIHIAIGIPNTLDSLKTFVEAEGCFSPGFATYGIYFWVYDRDTKKLHAATMDGVKCERSLAQMSNLTTALMPAIRWEADGIMLSVLIGQLSRPSPQGEVQIVGAEVGVENRTDRTRALSLYAALRPLGPAGGDVPSLEVAEAGDALLVGGRAALVAARLNPTAAGVLPTDTICDLAIGGRMPSLRKAESPSGDCSGALRWDFTAGPGDNGRFNASLLCPVLPGRRAVRHKWDGVSDWAQFDLAEPHSGADGILQPDPGLNYYRGYARRVGSEGWREQTIEYWARFYVPGFNIGLPSQPWNDCFRAILSHAAMTMNEGAPDVAVVNYNVFNRDGVYVANILQKSGKFDLAAACIDYFLEHPFNGRIYPEADNPGQILWIMGEHWKFTRDREWLARIYPSVQRLVALVRYCRTGPGPHWVDLDSLEFGDALAADRRQELKPGRCDGHHPEYTEAFDIAGLRAAVALAAAAGNEDDRSEWSKQAAALFKKYDDQFGDHLARDYGNYSVLWPCRLYHLDEGKAHEQFRGIGAKKPNGWRYFPLATAHQGLLAGNREAGWKTIDNHLAHEQMRGWYLLDEGGKSGAGGWRHARTTWNPNVAMPHGWAIAEVWLLMRDCLLFEDGDSLVLLPGVPPEWFQGEPFSFRELPTDFGQCTVSYRDGALEISGTASPPGGFVLRLPPELRPRVTIDGKPIPPLDAGDFLLPRGTRKVDVEFPP